MEVVLGHSGLRRHRPVILPPSKAGGGRCSVKPASRSLLRSKSARTTSLRSSPNPQLPTWNGQAKLEKETEEKKSSFIENILRRKKFILLLDDLWSEVDLKKIGVPQPTQENGSKIVFTTRKKEVCRHMRADDELKMDCLSTNEAWELFQNVVGEAPLKKDSEILTLAKKNSEKCHGLPLALNVIGKAMSCKEDVHEWRHANDVLKSSSREFPGMEENILSVLKFSYDGLEDDKMKSCFLYCSLFPEDYEIKEEELIEYWINEGFING
uniref:Uncharacterized protein n=1 Tax=Brassica campestris TaxID=3711 RepID=M4DQL7_BRACM